MRVLRRRIYARDERDEKGGETWERIPSVSMGKRDDAEEFSTGLCSPLSRLSRVPIKFHRI